MKTLCLLLCILLTICSAKAQFTVATISNGCYNSCFGSARISPATGYRYQWSTGDTLSLAENLCAGTYTCTITDTLGTALDTIHVVITQPDSITYSISVDSASCPGAHNGTISITMSGGLQPYYYCVIKADSGLNFVSTNTFTGLDTGRYNIVLADRNECGRRDTAFIGWSSNICTGIDDLSPLVHCSLQPKPVTVATSLSYELQEPLQLNISVYDLSGKKVLQLLSQPETKGPHAHPVNLSALAAGQYVLHIASNRSSYALPFVKQ